EEYAPHLLAGLAVWGYILNSASQGCHAFFQGEAYIRQCPLPLAIFPLRIVLGATFHMLISVSVVILFVTVLGIFDVRANKFSLATVLQLLPGIAMLFVFCWSLAVLLGLANVYFQDTQHLTEIGFQMLYFATPIMYKAEVLEQHNLSWMVEFNPVVVFLRLIRDPILDGTAPSTSTYLQGLGIIAAVAGLAAFAMSRLQNRLIFHL